MRKRLAILLIIVLLLSSTACSGPEGASVQEAPSASKDDDFVTIYLLTSETEYKEDGTKGTYQETYTYDDMGNLLTKAYDEGGREEYWEEGDIFVSYRYLPFDGIIESQYQYEYDQNGSIINLYREDTDGRFEDYTYQGVTYQYGSDGRIETKTSHYRLADGSAAEKTWKTYYRYDENGNLYRIEEDVMDSDDLLLCAKFSYDKQNRLTQAYSYQLEAARLCEYSYDDAGRLVSMNWSVTSYEEGIKESDTYSPSESYTFVYNENGDLISRKGYGWDGTLKSSVICEYDSGKLASVCYYDGEDVLQDRFTYTYESDGTVKCLYEHSYETFDSDLVSTLVWDSYELIYDEHGNLIQKGNVKYEYKAIRVTKAQAERYHRVQFLRNRMDADGINRGTFGYAPGCEPYALIPFPITSLYKNDLVFVG